MKPILTIMLFCGLAHAQGTYWRAGPYSTTMGARPSTCITGDRYTYTSSGAADLCTAPNTWISEIPSGLIGMVISGTCPAGWGEVAALNGVTVLGTLSANGDVGTTGGSDTITPAGVNAPNTTTGNAGHTHRAATDPSGNIFADGTNPAIPIPAQTFAGTAFDNRSKFLKVLFCSKN